MEFHSLCPEPEIGANSYLIDTGSFRIVLDAGMHPKREGYEAIPRFDDLDEDSADAAIVTHSHLDHIGSLPVLMREQPQMRVFASPAATDLGFAMLHNSVNVMTSKRDELGIQDYPLFHHRELDELEEKIETRANERPFEMDHAGLVKATFHDAGHVLGSVGVSLECGGQKIFYTGDVNFEDSTLIKGALFPEGECDTMIIETTRGDNERAAGYTREAEERRFAEQIAATLERGGAVMIPVFAIGKTQEVLTMIHRFKLEGLLPSSTPVVIGGLSTKMTVIYDRYAKGLSRRSDDEFRILRDMDLVGGGGRRRRKRAPIVAQPGGIYCISSGMMTEKTVSNQVARAGFLENPKNALLFVGYADPASPAGHIRAAARGDEVVLDAKHSPATLRCDVEVFDFSGHATRDQLLECIVRANPKRTFLVHGDPQASEWFASQLATHLPSTEAIIPRHGRGYELS